MSYAISPLIYENFKGIREQNGVNANGAISAIACNNVQLVQTEIGVGRPLPQVHRKGDVLPHP